jgi:hypothetical protein
MNAYQLKLNGWQAAWVTKKCCGHRTIPESILAEFDEELKHLA